MHRPVHRFPVWLGAGPGRAKYLKTLDDAHAWVRRGGHVTCGRTSLSSPICLFFIHAGSKGFGAGMWLDVGGSACANRGVWSDVPGLRRGTRRARLAGMCFG